MESPSKRYKLFDTERNEWVQADIYATDASKQGWQIVYARTLADYFDLTGHAPTKVLAYFLRKKSSDNLVIGSFEDIAEATGVSRRTVASMVKTLQKKGFLAKVKNAVYMVSPKLMRHGSRTKGIVLFRTWEDVTNETD